MQKELAPARYSVRVHHRNGQIEQIGITRDRLESIDWASREEGHVSVRNLTDGRIVYERRAAPRAIANSGAAA